MSVFSKTKINHGSNGKELGCINYEDLVEIDLSRQYFYSSIYKELKLHDNKLNPNYCLVPVKAYIMIKPLIYLDYTIYNDLHLNVSAALNSVIPDIKLQGKMVHDGQIGQFESYRFEKDFNVIAYKVEDYCLMHGLTDSKFYNSDDLL